MRFVVFFPRTMPPKRAPNDSMADLLEQLAAGLRARGMDEAKVTETVESVRSRRPPREQPDEVEQFASKVKNRISPILTLVATLAGGGGLLGALSQPVDRSDLLYQVMKEQDTKLERRVQALEANARSTQSWNLGVLNAQGVSVEQEAGMPEPAKVRVNVRPSPTASVAGAIMRVPSPRGAPPAPPLPAEVQVLTPPPVPPAPTALETEQLPASLEQLAKKRSKGAQGPEHDATP